MNKENFDEKRERRIKEAHGGYTERPYVIAFNIGYDDYPVWENPFDKDTSAHNGYESGFSTSMEQSTGRIDNDGYSDWFTHFDGLI